MRLLIVGLGYAAARVAARTRAAGGAVRATTRDGRGGTIRFAGPADAAALAGAVGWASHLLMSAPPDAAGRDPVLAVLPAGALAGRWLGYLSSTGVYGDVGGAWVDEGAPVGGGRRAARVAADAAWLALGARVLRLPGIYGPGRSALDRLRAGTATRVRAADVAPGQVFSRVHVDDLAAGVVAAFAGPAGAYNLADDEPAPADAVTLAAARLLGVEPPEPVPLAALAPASRGFYAESRRVAAGKAGRVLGWRPAHPDYRLGLLALSATTSPSPVSAAPATASADQR